MARLVAVACVLDVDGRWFTAPLTTDHPGSYRWECSCGRNGNVGSFRDTFAKQAANRHMTEHERRKRRPRTQPDTNLRRFYE